MPKNTKQSARGKKEWEDLGDNQVLRGKDYYVSYNPDTSASKMGLGIFFNMMGNSLSGGKLEDDGRAETALCKDGEFYILNGDFRRQYEKFDTFAQCKKFFDSKGKEFGSNWTTGKDLSLPTPRRKGRVSKKK